MPDQKLTREAADQFRRRVEYEDDLLNTRTNIVLTLNGLAAVAASFTQSAAVRLCISTVIVICDVLWLVCAADARWYIGKLTDELRKSDEIPADEAFRHRVQKGRIRIWSTRFMCAYLPALLLLAWVAGLALSIWFP